MDVADRLLELIDHLYAAPGTDEAPAVFLTDVEGRVTFMNPAASLLVAMRDGLAVERGQIGSPDSDATPRT